MIRRRTPDVRTHRRRALVAAGLLMVGGLAFSLTGSAQPSATSDRVVRLGAVPGQVGRAVTGISLESTTDGPESAIGGERPTVSEDGRLVAFIGPVSAGESTLTAFLRDRATDALVDLLPPVSGRRAGDTSHVVISSDGCSITLVTQLALDLFDDDDEGERWDVYRAAIPQCRPRDVAADALRDPSSLDWELVSSGSDGRARNDVDPADAPGVSAAGTVIAYVVPLEQRSAVRRVLVTDLTVPEQGSDRTVAIAGSQQTEPTDGAPRRGQTEPAVSGDGRSVAFTSDIDGPPAVTSAARPGDPVVPQVFVWDRTTSSPTIVSAVRRDGGRRVARGRGADQPSVSFDGSVVAFVSANSRVTGPAARKVGAAIPQVFVHRADGDRDGVADDPVIELVSAQSSDSGQRSGNGASWAPSVSADGSVVAFLTRSNDLLPTRARPGSRRSDGDVVVADLVGGGLRRVALRPDAAMPARAAHRSVDIAANGRVVVFETSAAADMVPGAPRAKTRQVMAATLPVSLSLPSLDAGTTALGRPSPEWFVTITNDGPSTFVPRLAETSDDHFRVTGGTCLGARVVSGGSCIVRVVFTPTDPGDVVGELTVAERGYRAAEVTTQLVGSGGDPVLSATPGGAAFPDTPVGAVSPPVAFEVRNIGLSPTTVAGTSIGGEDPNDVRVANSTCSGRVLPSNGVCTVEVVFAPTGPGVRAALVTFETATGSRTSVIVSGVATYRPDVVTLDEIQAGRHLDVLGWGYPSDTVLVVGWSDGIGRAVVVETDERGEFVARLAINEREPLGRRELVISDPSGNVPRVSSIVLVRPGR